VLSPSNHHACGTRYKNSCLLSWEERNVVDIYLLFDAS
jgi:hypothetical protein